MSHLSFLQTHPFILSTCQSKAVGTILGSALGDFIGLYTEFLPRSECLSTYPRLPTTTTTSSSPQSSPDAAPSRHFDPPLTPLRADSHRDKFALGAWTDDTDHSLLIILSYLHQRGTINPHDIAARLQTWCTQGLRALDTAPLGLGQTVGRIALDGAYLDGPPRETAMRAWLGGAAEGAKKPAANGSLMRTAALGVVGVGFEEGEAMEVARRVCEISHVDLRCVVSCVMVVGLVRGILRGEVRTGGDVDAVAEKAVGFVEVGGWDERMGGERDGDRLLGLEEFWKVLGVRRKRDLELDDRASMGYVYKCLGIAVLQLRKAMDGEGDFETLITEVVMSGGDTDTNACVAGALLGAWYGEERLPMHWRKAMTHEAWLMQKAKEFTEMAGINEKAEIGKLEPHPDTAPDGGKGFLTKEQIDEREKAMVFGVLEKSRVREEARKKAKGTKKGWFG